MPFEISVNLIIVSSILCLLLVILLYVRFKRMRSATYQIDATLRPHMKKELKDFIISDGIGGLLEIEHLILMEQGLLIIETYPVSGNLFGADKIDQWTQIVDGRSFKFINPLQRIHDARHALKIVAPKTPIFCRVIFSADSHFPKGKPEEISTLVTLAEDMKSVLTLPKVIDETRQEAWDEVMRIGHKDGQATLMAEG